LCVVFIIKKQRSSNSISNHTKYLITHTKTHTEVAKNLTIHSKLINDTALLEKGASSLTTITESITNSAISLTDVTETITSELILLPDHTKSVIFLKRYGFFWKEYSYDAYYWEIVPTLEKFTVTFILVIVSSTIVKVTLVIFLLCLILMLQIKVDPFVYINHKISSIVLNAGLLFTAICELLSLTQSSVYQDIDYNVVSNIMLAINIIALSIVILLFILDVVIYSKNRLATRDKSLHKFSVQCCSNRRNFRSTNTISIPLE